MVARVESIPLDGCSAASCQETPKPGQVGPAAVLREFLTGPENVLLRAVFKSIEGARSTYNPIIFCGPPGIGKTHLLTGLVGLWRRRNPGASFVLTSGRDLSRQFRGAQPAAGISSFRKRLQESCLVAVDDLDVMLRSGNYLAPLIDLIDHLVNTDGRFLATCRHAPTDTLHRASALRSRLSQGLTLRVAQPGLATRHELLLRYATLRNIRLQPSAARVLARGMPTTAPRLFQAVIDLQAYNSTSSRPIDDRLARRYLRDRSTSSRDALKDLCRLVAKHFDVSCSQLRGPTRHRSVVTARDVAIYLARQILGISFKDIGAYFGGRDHSTALYAFRKTERSVKHFGEVGESVNTLSGLLLEHRCSFQSLCE